MKPQTEKKVWSFVGLFIIALVISMPFYSADAMAVNVQITKNQGDLGIDKYLNADGDTWTVETLITDSTAEIKADEVKIKIGNKETDFDTCTNTDLGVTCEYISPLVDGIKEKAYNFQVLYYAKDLNGHDIVPTPGNGDVIKADGSAPQVQYIELYQNKDDGTVRFDFIADDKYEGVPSIGIKTIEILDADTGAVLKTMSGKIVGDDTPFRFSQENNGNILDVPFDGDGNKRIRVKAEDHLGHSKTSPVFTFDGDFVKPEIQGLELPQLGKFIGDFIIPSDVSVDVFEKKGLREVTAFSDQAALDGDVADCTPDIDEDGLYHCIWKNIEIKPEGQISVKVIAKDQFGNSAEKTLSQTFTKDVTAPKLRYFNSERMFDNNGYVKSGEQRIVLEVAEIGSGIIEDGIRANLGSLGGTENVPPTSCNETTYGLSCYWDTSASFTAGMATISLSKFEDNVGNDGKADAVEILVDTEGPKVEQFQIYGGDKDYFQSNDQLKINLVASELSGLIVLLDLKGIVNDAEIKYPASMYTRSFDEPEGWVTFTEKDCERIEGGKWNCEFYTDKIKSGPDEVQLKVKVQDTAGNDAASWPDQDVFQSKVKNAQLKDESNHAVLSFELLGLSTENTPDYWEQGKTTALGGLSNFIDLDTTELAYTRMPFRVVLETTGKKVEALEIKLVGCYPKDSSEAKAPPLSSAITVDNSAETPVPETTAEAPLTGQAAEGVTQFSEETAATEAPVVSRTLIYGGVTPLGTANPMPTIVIELEPFNGREMFNLAKSGGEDFEKHSVDYICKMSVFSKVGDLAINAAELQDVIITVPFGFTSLGSQDETLSQEIKRSRDEIRTGFWGVLGKLAVIMKWLGYIAGLASTIVGAINLINGIKAGLNPAYTVQITKAAGISACFGTDSGTNAGGDVVEALSVVINILGCTSNGNSPSWMKWYDEWLGMIPKYYNELLSFEVGQSPNLNLAGTQAGSQRASASYMPARSVKDNLYLSIAGVCLPGIIQNLDKYRQIKCRKVMCLENEVASGLTTIHACNELESMMICKYFIGELWYIFPFSQFFDKIITALWNSLKDPISLVHTISILGCGIACLADEKVSQTCQVIFRIWDAIDWLTGTVGFITTIVNDIKGGGLNYCDSVGLGGF